MKYQLTVIIPVYNGMPFLPETVDSILNQTYKDFRLLIIDDGSMDESSTYLNSLTDPRVEVRFQSNMGLCHSLNNAIASADSEFVARLDQDDIALPFRLQEQVDFLTAHPEYACVLGNISRITEKGKDFGAYDINSSEAISDYQSSLYGCIVHSTICFRREVFLGLGGYRPAMYPVDDYDLLLRLEENYKTAVINKPLIKYRIHGKAGTFKTFHDMELKTRYVSAMAGLRRANEPEISLTEFSKTLDQASPWELFHRNVNGRGKLMFRKAGLMIGEGQRLGGAMNLLGACLLAPRFAVGRLFALYRSKSVSE
jgi:glycosyltransferase involved in cell wall biosynthesis